MRIFFWMTFFFAFFGCKRNQQNKSATKPATADTIQFYNVPQFVQSQVDDVLKVPYFIFMKTSINGHVDSVVIGSQQFASVAKQFMNTNISSPSLKKDYTETAFLDKTTNTYTLNYSTKNKELEVQNIDVLLRDDGQTLKRIFIRKFFYYNNDSSAIEQLSWKPNEAFEIARMVQKPGEKEKMTQTFVVWNVKK